MPATSGQVEARSSMAWRPIGRVVAVAAAVHLAVLTRYGWHRDEFYYVICGRHLAWGYPDQPPLTPLLARLLDVGGLTGLRLGAVAAHLGCMVIAAALAAEFGGRRLAQILACATVAVSPLFMGAAVIFGTTVMDQLFWALTLLLVVRAVRTPTRWRWLAAGVSAGVGLEDKQTVVVLLVAILLGLVVSKRDALRGPLPWMAGVVALILWTPNVAWDATHGWANVKMAGVLAGRTGGPVGSAAMLIGILMVSPVLSLVAWVGLRRLWRGPDQWLAVTAITVIAVFTLSGGKPYYPAPVFVTLIGAGAVGVEAAAVGRRLPARWSVALGASFAAGSLVVLPVMSPTWASAIRSSDPVLMETYGWPGLVGEVSAAAGQVGTATVVFTSNYGEAGALTFYKAGARLTLPIVSGHNAYGDWGPPAGSDSSVLAVGEFDRPYLERFWGTVSEIAPLRLPRNLKDEETANHAAIYLCQQPRGTWAQLWPRLRHLD
jgi:4-amino-4-deoxy-L-arabinose transferase-like glycosyltransferase